MPRTERTSLAPALFGSALLHLGMAVLVALNLSRMAEEVKPPEVVPVELITGGEPAPPPMVEAPEPAPATVPEPAPEPEVARPPPPPAPAPPPPRPAPPPPKPQPAPKPAPAPPKPQPTPKPAPPKPQPPQPQARPQAKPTPRDDFDLDQLAASVARARPARAARPAAPRQGPPQPERGPETREAPARTLGPGDFAGMQARVVRAWNPNCVVAGGASVVVRVRVVLTSSGGLAGRPQVVSKSGASAEVVDVAAARAVSAIARAAPFTDVPLDLAAGQPITLNFNAKRACR
ncbi:MAG TPA: hypothetical protein VF559_09195 [Caulobacteraceae bacterium]|jgi:outer membrane biosynthesis protein TonB